MTTVYHYHPDTREFLLQSEAALDPLDRLPLIPAHATTLAPPETTEKNKTVQWDNTDENWVIVDDYRGQIFYDETGATYEIADLGIAPEPEWTTTKQFVLSYAKNLKKQQIRDAFRDAFAAADAPPVDALSLKWNGGYDSALKLDAAKRLAELVGKREVVLYDIYNTGHKMNVTDAETVIIAVGADYQKKFAKKQTLMRQVDALPDTSTQADIDDIAINFD